MRDIKQLGVLKAWPYNTLMFSSFADVALAKECVIYDCKNVPKPNAVVRLAVTMLTKLAFIHFITVLGKKNESRELILTFHCDKVLVSILRCFSFVSARILH